MATGTVCCQPDVYADTREKCIAELAIFIFNLVTNSVGNEPTILGISLKQGFATEFIFSAIINESHL